MLEVRLPVSRPTSVTFGGTDLRDLYITSASTELSPRSEQLSHSPAIFSPPHRSSWPAANFFAG